MSITEYNTSLMVIPTSSHMEFQPMFMKHVALRYEDADFDDCTMRQMNLKTVFMAGILGPLVVIPGRVIFSIWNLSMTIFTGMACLGTLGCLQTVNDCCWKALIDAFSEIYALATFLVALPILFVFSLLGAILHPAIAAPAWWMMKGLSLPLDEVRSHL
jgi:hypothetical protein